MSCDATGAKTLGRVGGMAGGAKTGVVVGGLLVASIVTLSGCASKGSRAETRSDTTPGAALHTTAERVRPKSPAARRPATELLDEAGQSPVAMAMASEQESQQPAAITRAARGLEQMLQGGGAVPGGEIPQEMPSSRASRPDRTPPSSTDVATRQPTRTRLRPPPIELPSLPRVSAAAAVSPEVEVAEAPRLREGNDLATGQTSNALFAPVTKMPSVASVSGSAVDTAAAAMKESRSTVNGRVAVSGAAAAAGDPVLKIRHFAAASRVESFGRYTPMDLKQVAAGQPVAMLLYTELDGFAHRSPAGLPPPPEGFEAENDRGQTEWIVKVSQEVAVYGPGDVLVRAVPSQVARDASKRRRRDHYLVQRLDLPRTLAAGEYRIKVSVKDEATGQVAESIIPMTIVRGVSGR